jgi:hypothetical protein
VSDAKAKLSEVYAGKLRLRLEQLSKQYEEALDPEEKELLAQQILSAATRLKHAEQGVLVIA